MNFTTFEMKAARFHDVNITVFYLALIGWIIAIGVLLALDLPTEEGDSIYKPVSATMLTSLLVYGILNIRFGLVKDLGLDSILKTLVALVIGGVGLSAVYSGSMGYFFIATALYLLIIGFVYLRLKIVAEHAAKDTPNASDASISDIQRPDSFKDLLKRGNLPGDDREVPNWLKIKNRQFDDVDVSHNTVDAIIALSSDEFNEFASSCDDGLLLTYLSTLSEGEMNRFYQYCDDVVKLDESQEMRSAKEIFQAAMEKIDQLTRTDEALARATLEVPLMINFSKNIYHKTLEFRAYIAQDYFDYEADDAFKAYEGNLVKIIWGEMNCIPDHFEQVLDQFKDFYDEENPEHRAFFNHLCKRFGKLIAVLNNLVVKTQERNTSLNWFTGKMVEYELIGDYQISISQSKAMTTDQKLINFLTTTFLGICDENEDNYLSSLICVVETLFEWYPIKRETCEYAMVEMMKSVAIKEVNVENANSFIDFFGELPRLYAELSYDHIYELKELINHTMANHKPQDNRVFEQDGVKNKLILLNYIVDMEDLYYESGKTVEETQ